MDIVTTTDALERLCDGLARADFITIDTEFMRDNTYWPQLCLIQLAGPKASDAWCIDPLAHGIDLSPLYGLLRNDTVLKVFHAGRQDIEIFHHRAGLIPAPVFDTQIAAMVCGFGDQVGYEQLARQLAKAKIDKASRFTDWSKRPLTNKQLHYAIADVTHLRDVYRALQGRLETNGRAHWLDEEMRRLSDPQTYDLHPDRAWKRVKIRLNHRRDYTIAKTLSAWREALAQKRDVPRGRVLKDDQINEIARQKPRTTADLGRLRSLGRRFANGAQNAAADEIVTLVNAVMAQPVDALETLPRPSASQNQDTAAVDLLKILLKHVSERHQVAPRLVATTHDIRSLVEDRTGDVSALKGWRREIFGADALRLLDGELAISYEKGAIALVPAVSA